MKQQIPEQSDQRTQIITKLKMKNEFSKFKIKPKYKKVNTEMAKSDSDVHCLNNKWQQKFFRKHYNANCYPQSINKIGQRLNGKTFFQRKLSQKLSSPWPNLANSELNGTKSKQNPTISKTNPLSQIHYKNIEKKILPNDKKNTTLSLTNANTSTESQVNSEEEFSKTHTEISTKEDNWQTSILTSTIASYFTNADITTIATSVTTELLNTNSMIPSTTENVNQQSLINSTLATTDFLTWNSTQATTDMTTFILLEDTTINSTTSATTSEKLNDFEEEFIATENPITTTLKPLVLEENFPCYEPTSRYRDTEDCQCFYECEFNHRLTRNCCSDGLFFNQLEYKPSVNGTELDESELDNPYCDLIENIDCKTIIQVRNRV